MRGLMSRRNETAKRCATKMGTKSRNYLKRFSLAEAIGRKPTPVQCKNPIGFQLLSQSDQRGVGEIHRHVAIPFHQRRRSLQALCRLRAPTETRLSAQTRRRFAGLASAARPSRAFPSGRPPWWQSGPPNSPKPLHTHRALSRLDRQGLQRLPCRARVQRPRRNRRIKYSRCRWPTSGRPLETLPRRSRTRSMGRTSSSLSR